MARAIDAYSLNNDFVEWYNDQTDEIAKSVLREIMQKVNNAPTLTPEIAVGERERCHAARA